MYPGEYRVLKFLEKLSVQNLNKHPVFIVILHFFGCEYLFVNVPTNTNKYTACKNYRYLIYSQTIYQNSCTFPDFCVDVSFNLFNCVLVFYVRLFNVRKLPVDD